MMYSFPFKATLLAPKCDIKVKRMLGRGKCGVVYEVLIDDKQCALKVFDDENTFKRECKAYEKASQTHELRHRVPALQGVFNRVWELFRDPHLYSRAIRLDVVQGDCLDMVIDSLSLPRRQQVHESLRTTVEILHEKAGVCHRDIRDANAMVLMDDDDEQVRLIDFSHAGFRDDMDTGLWERRKEADHIRLHGIFAGPDARSATNSAFAMLTPETATDSARQNELAKLVDVSSSSLPLLAAIEHNVPDPTPTLALSIVCSFQRCGEIEIAIDFGKKYLARKENSYQAQQLRAFLRLRITLARYQGEISFKEGLALYDDTIAEFTEQLGELHVYTLQARFDCAELWRAHGPSSLPTALDLYIGILRTLSKSSLATDQARGMGPASRWKKNLIETVRGVLPRLQDRALRTRAEKILQFVSPPQHEPIQPDRNTKRKHDAKEMVSQDEQRHKRIKGDFTGDSHGKIEESNKENLTSIP